MPEEIDNTAEFERRLELLTSRRVLVGIPAENDPRQGEPIGNVLLGYVHEFGSPARNIPARPFLVPGVESVEDQISARFEKAAREVLAGNTATLEARLAEVGVIAVRGVTNRIEAGIPPPLRPATIARRRRRSAGSSYRRQATQAADTTPLIDTGDLLKSITYVVE